MLRLLLAVAALGGCGDDDDEPAAPRTASTPAGGAIELSIRYDDGAGRDETALADVPRRATQRAGGSLTGRAPAASCARRRARSPSC